jgi:glutamate dehydrogenase (NAD(P)+)
MLKTRPTFARSLARPANASFAVRAAASLSEALQLIAKNSFDVFLIDVAVPDSDGIRGLQRLVTAAKNTPVIIVTSIHDATQAIAVVRAGADDYVVKSRMNSTAYERVLSYAIERHGVRKQADVSSRSRVSWPNRKIFPKPAAEFFASSANP